MGFGCSTLLWARPRYNLVATVILLDENLVTLGHLNLLLFQWKGNSTNSFILLKDFALLRAIVVVVDVVSESTLQIVHLTDDLVVLLPISSD